MSAPHPVTAASVPRLQPVPADRWDETARAALRGRLDSADKYLTGAADAPRTPNALGIFAHHPRLGGAWLGFNGELLDVPALQPRQRELVVLRVAWRTRSLYEWVQHVRMAQQVGVSVDEVQAVARGAEAEVWTPLEGALLAATDQLIDRHGVDEGTWSRLAEHLDRRQLLELLFVIGSYLCLALVFNAVGLELDPDLDPDLDATAAPVLPVPT